MQGANPCPINKFKPHLWYNIYEVRAWNSANMENIVCAPLAPIKKSVMSAVTVSEKRNRYMTFGLAQNMSARKNCDNNLNRTLIDNINGSIYTINTNHHYANPLRGNVRRLTTQAGIFLYLT